MSRDGDGPRAVLFACALNAVRSPMAAAILRHLSGDSLRIESAGVRAGLSDPFAVAVMDEIGIDISDHEPRALRDLEGEVFDLIITLSPEAHHHGLEMTRIMPADVEYWPTRDVTPYAEGHSREEALAQYRDVRDKLFRQVKERFTPGSGGPTV